MLVYEFNWDWLCCDGYIVVMFMYACTWDSCGGNDVVFVVDHVALDVVIVVICCCCDDCVHGKLLEVIRDGLGRLHLGCCCCLGCVIVVSIVVVDVVDVVVVWGDDLGYDFL